jgi:hypothetical protein
MSCVQQRLFKNLHEKDGIYEYGGDTQDASTVKWFGARINRCRLRYKTMNTAQTGRMPKVRLSMLEPVTKNAKTQFGFPARIVNNCCIGADG